MHATPRHVPSTLGQKKTLHNLALGKLLPKKFYRYTGQIVETVALLTAYGCQATFNLKFN